MNGWTRRQWLGAAAAAVLVAVTVVAGLAGWPRVALVALGLTLGLLFLALLQVRRRLAELARHTDQLSDERRSWRELQRQRLHTEREQERLVRTGLAHERHTAADRHRALVAAIEQHRSATDRALRHVADQLARQARDQTREVEALLQLFNGFAPRGPMPSSGHWALNPTDLLQLRAVVDQRRPKLVLELGSGTSSVWLGYAVERWGGRLVSLEHDPAYAELTRTQLHRHGLDQVAEVRVAPLTEVSVDGENFQWYEPTALAGLAGVDLLAVDGPPGATGPRARYPALPLLVERLSPRAAVLLDDADRPDEQEILRQWCEWLPGLVREPATVGHLAVLSYTAPAPPGAPRG